jgi:undecaprenyl-diphosphatase
MIDKLIELDTELLLYLNSYHADWLDPIMLTITETFFWLPLYLFLLYLVFRVYGKNSWVVLASIAVTIVLTDQITSGFMKPYFARLRPSNEPSLIGLVHLVNGYKGGHFGFASSHAANTLGTAMFFWLLFRDTKKWIVWLFPWAIIMTYTRIYLGVHYPGDIIVGGTIGLICGWIGYRVYLKLKAWNDSRVKPAMPDL